MWRWSLLWPLIKPSAIVFSTYVEVIPRTGMKRCWNCCFLHVCGGDPRMIILTLIVIKFSPRMWRWSYALFQHSKCYIVFSTYVEVILTADGPVKVDTRFLHVCGGDPKLEDKADMARKFSPRMWRWSYLLGFLFDVIVVFSTYVEVILTIFVVRGNPERFLHVCGGDPRQLQRQDSYIQFSPRRWRWS